MKTLTIEWRHYDKGGKTCDRCAATGTTAKEVISGLKGEFAKRGINISLIETLLSEEEMSQSNLLLFNGIPVEELLDNADATENSCESCSCLTGKETSCRTVIVDGKFHDEIPAELIRQAALKALTLMHS